MGRVLAFAWRTAPQWLIRPFVVRFLTTAMGPEPTLFRCGAVLVDPDGRAVPIDFKNTARNLPLTPARLGYIVFDAQCAEQLRSWPNFVSTAPGVAYAYLDDYRRGRPDIYHSADTVEGLAAMIGARPELLAESLGKHRRSPWFALGPLRGVVTLTDGGLAVDTLHRVLGQDDQPIPGLYAAGSTGQGAYCSKGMGTIWVGLLCRAGVPAAASWVIWRLECVIPQLNSSPCMAGNSRSRWARSPRFWQRST